MPDLTTEFWSIVWLSLRVSGTAVLISCPIGVPCGVWLGLSRRRAVRYVSAIVQTGMALPPVVTGLVLYLLVITKWTLSHF